MAGLKLLKDSLIIIVKVRMSPFQKARRAGSDGSMSASGSAGSGFDPLRGSKFSFEYFQPRSQEGWRCTLSNRQIVHHNPGLNSKPFRSIYVEKAYSTVDSDSSVGWGRYAWRPPWCFSRRAGYDPAPGFTFSLSFIIQHNTITLHKQSHLESP